MIVANSQCSSSMTISSMKFLALLNYKFARAREPQQQIRRLMLTCCGRGSEKERKYSMSVRVSGLARCINFQYHNVKDDEMAMLRDPTDIYTHAIYTSSFLFFRNIDFNSTLWLGFMRRTWKHETRNVKDEEWDGKVDRERVSLFFLFNVRTVLGLEGI